MSFSIIFHTMEDLLSKTSWRLFELRLATPSIHNISQFAQWIIEMLGMLKMDTVLVRVDMKIDIALTCYYASHARDKLLLVTIPLLADQYFYHNNILLFNQNYIGIVYSNKHIWSGWELKMWTKQENAKFIYESHNFIVKLNQDTSDFLSWTRFVLIFSANLTINKGISLIFPYYW